MLARATMIDPMSDEAGLLHTFRILQIVMRGGVSKMANVSAL